MKGKKKLFDKESMVLNVEKMTKKSINENQMSRNELSKKRSLQEKGITLIALVVTIIILLILAGVTLNMALSQDGLFSKTQEAADKYKQAQEDEEIEVEKIEYAAEGKDIKEVEKISDKAGFEKFKKEVNEGKNFENTLVKLYCDIDLSGETWTPIGTEENPFNGVFNGNGHKITNLNITSGEEPSGLFGCAEGIIENIGIESGNITASGNVGGIVGKFSGTIENCYNKVNITANIENTVSENGRTTGVGGIVGNEIRDINTNIIRCRNTGDIIVTETGCTRYSSLVGGIYGVSSLNCEECINEGDITFTTDGDNPMCGGIGGSSNNIRYCYNTGTIFCKSTNDDDPYTAAGGLSGQTRKSGSIFIGCFSVGEAKIEDLAHSLRVGEITGMLYMSLETCFGLKHGETHLCGDDIYDREHKNDVNLLQTEKDVYTRIIEMFPDVFTWSGDKAVLKWELNAQ